ncbi:MAG TPA: hypothetical protein ENH19_00175 [Actinobacteria bacterium]|nr:hypothetical protein [Actinomycetes bacterium]HEX21052.1 hypothetical protein [Actinomycetota bacterium]
MDKQNGFIFSDIVRGIYGGIIGSLCCVLPLAGIAAGIGFIPGIMTAPRYRLYFIAAGLILVLFLTWRRLRKTNLDRSRKISVIITTLASFFLVIALFTYVITPAAANLINKYSSTNKNLSVTKSIAAKPGGIHLVTLKLSGLTCSSCKIVVEKLVNQVNGVKKVDVNVESSSGKVTYDANITNKEAIAKAVEGGFKGNARTAYKAEIVNDVKIEEEK